MDEPERLPDNQVSTQAAREIRGQLRDYITEMLLLTSHYCNLAVGHLDVNDDAGCNYSMNLAKEHFKAAIATYDDLTTENILAAQVIAAGRTAITVMAAESAAKQKAPHG